MTKVDKFRKDALFEVNCALDDLLDQIASGEITEGEGTKIEFQFAPFRLDELRSELVTHG